MNYIDAQFIFLGFAFINCWGYTEPYSLPVVIKVVKMKVNLLTMSVRMHVQPRLWSSTKRLTMSAPDPESSITIIKFSNGD